MSVPVLRFKGYSDLWNIVTLDGVSENVMYGMGAAAMPYDGINKYLRITDIDEASREFRPAPLCSPDGLIEEKYKLKIGDLVFARTGASVGKSYLYKEADGNLLFAGFLVKFHITRANPYFVYLQTLSGQYKNWLLIMSMRSGQPGVNAEELKGFCFKAPILQEQTKIANFLTAVDEKIQHLTQKADLLLQYKKGVMRQIFSQELRFKDDDGGEFPPWENYALLDIAQIIMGSSPQSDAYNEIGNGLPLIQGNADIKERVSAPRVFTSQITKECIIGDILLSVRAPVGTVAKSGHHACIGRGIAAVRSKKQFYQQYLYQWLLAFEPKWKSLSQGSTFESVNSDEIKNLELEIPTLIEQTKIANFLTAIDDKITHTKTQLAAVKQYKQALLQQMFV